MYRLYVTSSLLLETSADQARAGKVEPIMSPDGKYDKLWRAIEAAVAACDRVEMGRVSIVDEKHDAVVFDWHKDAGLTWPEDQTMDGLREVLAHLHEMGDDIEQLMKAVDSVPITDPEA